jgi:hypothetical protein
MGVCQYQMFGNVQGFVTIFCLVGERPTLMVLHHHSSLNTSRARVIPVCRRRNLEDAAELEGVHRPWQRATTTFMKRASQAYFPKRFLWKALPSVGMTCIQGLPA